MKKNNVREYNKQVENVENKQNDNKLSLKRKIIRTCFVAVLLCAFFVLIYYILVWTGAWEHINTTEKVKALIDSMGFWGKFIFVMLQFLQVTFIPLPSTVTTLAGVLIYGPLQTALLSLAGILLGSSFAFLLGRIFGKKVVTFMVGEQTCEKWTKFLTDAKYSFFVMMLLPVFPDDVLCLVAGVTDISWTFFVVTNLISRPLAIFATCYIGSGEIIPYHGWGLAVWAVIVVVVVVLIILSYKYRDQIENFIKKICSPRKKLQENDAKSTKTEIKAQEKQKKEQQKTESKEKPKAKEEKLKTDSKNKEEKAKKKEN